jgi:enoyl-CoA hydratase
MDYKTLKTEKTGGQLVVTISRPNAMNALNSLVFDEFNRLLDQVSGDAEVKVLVITGEGKAFVAGADIAEMASMTPEQAYSFSRKGQEVFIRFGDLEIPVIAAVNGYALGGGCELAMACDFRIASRNAKFGQPEVNLGLIPGYAGTQRLSRLTGLGNALYLVMTAETISAEEALRIGLVQKVTEPETLLEEVKIIAKKIVANGSTAITLSKEIIRKGSGVDFREGSELEARAFAGLFDLASSKEGMKAFLEKRKPAW